MVKRTGHQEMGRPRSEAVRGAMARQERMRRTRQEDMLVSSAWPKASKLGALQVVSYSLSSHMLVITFSNNSKNKYNASVKLPQQQH